MGTAGLGTRRCGSRAAATRGTRSRWPTTRSMLPRSSSTIRLPSQTSASPEISSARAAASRVSPIWPISGVEVNAARVPTGLVFRSATRSHRIGSDSIRQAQRSSSRSSSGARRAARPAAVAKTIRKSGGTGARRLTAGLVRTVASDEAYLGGHLGATGASPALVAPGRFHRAQRTCGH